MKINLFPTASAPFLKKKLTLFALMFGFVLGWGQTTIFDVAGGGILPTGWVGTNNVTTNPIDKTSYYLFDAGAPSDNIVTATYDLSTYSTATLTMDVATFGSGSDNPAKIEISYNGTTYTQTITSATPISTTYVKTTSIVFSSTLTATVKIRISNNGTSGKGVRLQNLKLVATAPSCTSPTTQASAFTSNSITQTTANAGWTRGNGNNVLVLAKAGSAVDEDPSSGTSYTANSAFGSGDQIGTGNFVVYNGAGTSVNLTALTAGTNYHFAVYEYNTTGTCYNTAELVGNFTTVAAPGCTSIVSDGLNNSSTLFTLSGGAYLSGTTAASGVRPTSSPRFSEGTSSYSVAGGTATLTSSDINTSNYTGNTLTFDLAAFSGTTGNGVDASDAVNVEISPNGGIDWYSTLEVIGNSNNYWPFSAAGNATTAYDGNVTPDSFVSGDLAAGISKIKITNLPASFNLKIRVTLNNDANEIWLVDNFNICGTLDTNPKLTISGTLNEATLNNATVALTLANDTFADATLASSNFTLSNAPSGVSVSSVTYNSATSATLTLAYDNTDFDDDVTTFKVTINNAELAISAAPLVSNNLTITSVVETLTPGTSLAFGSVCNGSSSILSFTLNGTGLKAGNINLAAVTGYTYSETLGGVYTPTLSFAQSGGNLSKEIFVKLTPTAANINYAGSIVISGGAAANKNKAVSGNSNVIIASVVTNTASSVNNTYATLRTTSSTLGSCPTTIERGFVYSINSVNPNPINGGTGVNTSPNALLTGAFTQSVTGLAEGTTYAYQAYLFDGTTYIYGGVITFTTSISAPTNVTGTTACMQDDTALVTWNASANATGYLVFAVANATYGTGTPTTSTADYNNANANFSAGTNNSLPASLGKLLYNGNETTVYVTGLTENTAYSFRVIAYKAGAELRNFANGTTNGSKFENAVAQDDVKTFTGTPSNTQVTLNWSYYLPVSCFDEVIIVANQGPVVFTPTGDGSAYTANSVYSTPNQVVYKGTATSKSISGLINGLQYCFKIFVRRGTTWSDGTQICLTPDVTYCASNGNTTFQTSITSVQFNTINNTSSKPSGYSDYTAISTDVLLGSTHAMTLKVNTAGNYNVYSKVWIDWNHDGSFGSSEEYDLGNAANVTNGITSESPLDILIPHNAVMGNTRMRVSVRFSDYATPCQTAYDGEVEDYTINIIQPTNAEINVKGGAMNISIPNGFDAPNGLNNTQFSTTNLNTDSAIKDFTIQNVGLADLTLSGIPKIDIAGANPGDFIVTQQATSPIGTGTSVIFSIKFRPTLAGLRSAIVSIVNNDSDENPYTFAIEGTGKCLSNPVLTVFPVSGPANTVVEFNSGTNNLTGATVTYNDAVLPVISNSGTNIQVAVPANANDGIFVVQFANGCTFTQDFDVYDIDVTACGSSATTNASDLLIYEVYDENGGSGGVVTILNNTGASVDLSTYKIERAKTYGSGYITYANLSGTLTNGALAIVGVIGNPGSLCPYISSGNGNFGSGFNENDGIRLVKGATVIDDFKAPNRVGYYLKRKLTNLSPSPTFFSTQWTTQSISFGQCLPNVGVSPVIKTPPVLLTSPIYPPSCAQVILSVTGQEGVAGGNPLAYQWFALAPMSNSWVEISDNSFYSGSSTENLTISDLIGTDGYQYYAQIRENTATCYIASNATKVELQKNTWISSWSNGLPTANTNVTIAGTYNTQINGSLDICRLTVNSPGNLLIKSGAPVKVKNKITNNSTADNFVIETGGTLIQEDIVTNTGSIKAERNITDLGNVLTGPNAKMDYVFWSSPVTPQNIQNFSPGTPANRLFEYKESNDRFVPTGDVSFLPAKGYAIRAETTGVTSPNYDKVYNFQGVPNNGNYDLLLSRSADENGIEHGYSLVGNPYPSNLSFDELYELNPTTIYKTAWFWTNTTFTYSQLGSGYNGNNYAVYNATGGNSATVPADVTYNAIVPDGKVSVGQAFLVQLRNVGSNQTISFKNKNGENFLRVSESADFYQKNSAPKNRYWLKLIAPNNLQNTQLIGYIEDATDSYEKDFDAKAISDTSSNLFYSLLEGEKLIIQGKGKFDIKDKVLVGANIFSNGNYTIGLSRSEGIFENIQHIYLKDHLLNTYTDLTTNDYNFAADAGVSEGRFEIRYQPESVLATGEDTKNQLQVYRNGDDFIIQSGSGIIDEVEVFDSSGRLFQKVKGGAAKLVVDGKSLVNGIYILKIKRKSEIVSKKIMK